MASATNIDSVCRSLRCDTDGGCDIEICARIQFIRALDLLSERHGLTWAIVGGFLRRLFANRPMCGSNLDIVITSKNPTSTPLNHQGKIQKLMKDVAVIGYVEQPFQQGQSPHHYHGTCSMSFQKPGRADKFNVNFKVVFSTTYYTGSSNLVSSDHLILTADGLTTRISQSLDFTNTSIGVSLLSRISELQASRVRLDSLYINAMQGDLYARIHNSRMMLKECELQSEGLTIVGRTIGLTSDEVSAMQKNRGCTVDTCPVCLESHEAGYTTVLQCGHVFYMSCLAMHLSGQGDNHGQCPLCRAAIGLMPKS